MGNSVPRQRKPAQKSSDDLENVRLARKGDHRAFETLFHKYRERIFRVAYRYVYSAEDAMDVTQDAFVKAYQALHTFRENANFYTWICRIAINKAIDYLRSRRTRKTVSFDALTGEDEAMPPFEGSPDEAPTSRAELDELRRAVADAVESLPDYHRDVIVLNANEDFSYKQIAEALGISVGTVMSRLYYARKALKEKLKGFLPGEAGEKRERGTAACE